MKSAVIYYSLEGNTDLIAKMISERVGSDLIRLKPESDINPIGSSKYFFGGKSVLLNEKPKLENEPIDLDQYDTLFIGTPIWAGSYTPAINTFLSENTIKNKSIYLFATHRGGSADKCFAKMKAKLIRNTIKGTAEFADVKQTSAIELDDRVKKFCQMLSI